MQKYYNELIVTPNSYNELFLELISEIHSDAIEIKSSSYIVRSEDSLDSVLFGIEEFAKELSSAFQEDIKAKLTLTKKLNEDWIKSYQDSIQPVEVDKFYIRPNWFDKRDDLIDIIIDPSLAFGSGHHESTNNCLKLISKYNKNNFKVLDVGCGSGILGIAAAKMGSTVDLCDTDIESINASNDNFKTNGVEFNEIWEGSISNLKKEYNLVIANIVADVLIFLSKDLKNATKSGGYLILSGIMENYRDRVLKKFKDFEIEEIVQSNEWITIILKNSK